MAAPFGVHGWVKVTPYTATPQALLAFAAWRMTMRGEREAREFRVAEGRVHGESVVARLEGVASREAAAGLRGSVIEVPRAALPAAGEDEVYLADLPGCRVVNRHGEALGTVAAVEGYGAQPLLRVAPEGGGAARLIPLVPAHVTNVDLEARVIEVDWSAVD